MKRLFPRLLLLAVSLASGALLAEGLLRWVFHAAPLLDLDIYYFDAAHNLRFRPGLRRRHVTRYWDVAISINQEGFRDRQTPLSAPESPILALGDSFAFGWGVNLEETYLYLLEQHLNEKRPVRVIKAGINGTGTGDQFRFLESIGPQYRPQMILLSFFVGNDFTDVQMGGVDQFEVKRGLLLRRALRPPSRLEALQQGFVHSSHLLQFLRAVQLDFERRRGPARLAHAGLAARDPWLAEFSKVHLRNYPEETARAVTQTLAYLDRMENYCRQEGAGFVVMVIPRSMQIYPDELAEWKSAFRLSDQDLDLDHPQRILRDWAAGKSVRLLDLLPAFRDYAASHPGQKLYYYPDAHFNAAGHKLVGELLGAYLDQTPLSR